MCFRNLHILKLSVLLFLFPISSLVAFPQGLPQNDNYRKVIVHLRVPNIDLLTAKSAQFGAVEPGKALSSVALDADKALAEAIAFSSNKVLGSMFPGTYRVNQTYVSVPFIALDVTNEAYQLLASSTDVLGIEKDEPLPLPEYSTSAAKAGIGKASSVDPPALQDSVPLIGASNAWQMGYTGSGWYVAILDSGIRKTHQMFQGKTIVEACFSNSANCPNGQQQMIGSGAAAHYPSSYEGYDHGTHVAGISTGSSGQLSGVAKSANIIAINVFSRFPATEEACKGKPCVLTYDSDQVKGLDTIYSWRASYAIASVNMSLGGGKFTSSAACDQQFASRKASIDNLRAVGIPVVIATGNNGYCDGIGSPACISSAISVGATTKQDKETDFNNWYPNMVTFFAPGASINSSTGDSDSSYAAWNGTSMATPHVAGAMALLKQAKSSATVTELVNALKTTGKLITTGCSDQTQSPRIQVDKAISQLGGSSNKATVLSLNSVNGAALGATAELAAQVKNTSTSVLGSTVAVWFYVKGPNWSNNWVGSASASGLAAGGTALYSYKWAIPSSATTGNYEYWAIVYEGSTQISAWSSAQPFTVGTGGGGTASAAVTSLYGVSGAVAGGSAELWAQVKNTGTATLPSNTLVWFYVQASGVSDPWVGSASVAGLAAGSSAWYKFPWTIPSSTSGAAAYWARVYSSSTAISEWSTKQDFAIGGGGGVSAQVLSLYPVGNAVVGGSCKLWAQIKNTGNAALPSGSSVWFYVEAGGLSSPWVGSAAVAGLNVSATAWFSYDWTIPSGVTPGSAKYYARVYTSSNAISEWSGAQSFTISGGGGGSSSAQVVGLYPVSGAYPGGKTSLWANVKNTGSSALPTDAAVWFAYQGPGMVFADWAGGVYASNLAAGATSWFGYSWSIPTNLYTGTYAYWARVYIGTNPISEWSSSQSFSMGSSGSPGLPVKNDFKTAPDLILPMGRGPEPVPTVRAR